MSDSDEPREHYRDATIRKMAEQADEPRESYWHCVKYANKEQSDIFAAVLAEVARQDANPEKIQGMPRNSLEWWTQNAAFAIREVIRLRAEGE